jgi:uncharacterized protein (TIGR04255 family)
MALTRPLAHPPIREAIIEVKSELVDFSRVDAVRERLAGAFPNAKPFRLASVALQLPEERRGADAGQTGWRCESEDGTEVALVRTDGLSYGRLAGYPGWEAFVDRFMGVWGIYVEAAAPVEVRRVGVRYVNDLRLPIGNQVDFERYLTCLPRAPAGLAPELADFLVQMTLPGGVPGLRSAVTQATDTSARSDHELPVILDIDTSWERTLPVDERLPMRLPEALGTIRALKNRVFFGLLTEELVSTYA